MNINKGLSLALVASVAIVILKIEFPSGTSIYYRIFEAAYWFSVSYVPGFLVYIFIVYLPRKRDQKALSVFIADQTAMLFGDLQVLVNELSKAANHPIGAKPTAEDFNIICSKINPNDKAPVLKKWNPLEHENWLEFLYDRKERAEKTIDLLLRYMLYLEAEHIHLITEIKGCTFFILLDNVSRFPITNEDIGFLASSLSDYYALIHDLAEYSDKHRKVAA